VEQARKVQYERYGRRICNARVSFEELEKASPLTSGQQEALQMISVREALSNRVQIKLICLARTISDLNGEDRISDGALEEVFSYRKISGVFTNREKLLLSEEKGWGTYAKAPEKKEWKRHLPCDFARSEPSGDFS